MGRSYEVPRNVRGESRILFIFTIKSLITTFLGVVAGLPLFFIMMPILGQIPAMIILVVFGGLGYLVGTLKIPDSNIVGNLRKAGGETLTDIFFRVITFRGRKKIYVYRGGNK